jgi:hypothetical protein
MADAYKTLYQGQLTASIAALYTVPTAKSAIVRHISVVSNDASSRTFALYRNGAAAVNIITPAGMTVLPNGMQEFDGAMALAAGDTIQGVASVTAVLSVTIDGDEIT